LPPGASPAQGAPGGRAPQVPRGERAPLCAPRSPSSPSVIYALSASLLRSTFTTQAKVMVTGAPINVYMLAVMEGQGVDNIWKCDTVLVK